MALYAQPQPAHSVIDKPVMNNRWDDCFGTAPCRVRFERSRKKIDG
jgi:hypothetical protein